MVSFRITVSFCATLAALTACSDAREYAREKYTGERYGDAVGGPRRPPVLNPAYAQAKQPVVRIAPAAPNAPIVPEKIASAAPTPYDQYDNNGNDTTRTNYVKEWVRGKEEQPITAGRKAFRGSVAALQPAEPVALVPDKPPEHLIRPVPPAPQTKEVPPAIVPESDNGVFIPEPQKRAEAEPSAPVQLSQLQPAAGGQPPASVVYPHLADVPKVPVEFGAVKEGKVDAEKELQMQHESAMEQKKLLNEEPTELSPATLPQVQGMLEDIKGAITGSTPIIQASR